MERTRATDEARAYILHLEDVVVAQAERIRELERGAGEGEVEEE